MPPRRATRDKRPTRVERAASDGPRWWSVAVVLTVAMLIVYGRSLDAPFIFDDVDGIENNDSIVSLWPLVGSAVNPGPLNPPANLPSSGRPIVNVSLAANYHWSGLKPFGYHVFSVTIHVLAAILLWAVVRRTLLLPYFAGRFEASASWLALATALVWALHPLQTEAVIYVTQRSELLMALFYLATLYCGLRYWSSFDAPVGKGTGGVESSPSSNADRYVWLTLAVMASLAGMASKEVMVSVPLMILLFDRTFISGSLAKALRRSWPLYVGLVITWLLLLALNIHSPRGKSAGFGLGPPLATWWLTQAQVVLMYLKLVVWPWPLLIYYRLPYLETFSQAWMYVIPIVALLVATLILLWRNHPVGYLLAWPLVILAPTSIVPILSEIAAERRMYLPLAAIAVLFVVGGYWVTQLAFKPSGDGRQGRRLVAVGLVVALSFTFGIVSVKRLRAYQDPSVLWFEVVQHQPQNALAHSNLGSMYGKAGRVPEAIEQLKAAVALDPDDHNALTNLGQALTETGQFGEAIEKLNAALAREPDDPIALNNLGVALVRSGRNPEAVVALQRAVQLRPRFAMAHNSLGGAFFALGKKAEAIEEFQIALSLDPNLTMARENVNLLLSPRGQTTEPAR